MFKGIDLLPQEPVRVQVRDKEYPLRFAGGKTLALLEARFGGPLLTTTIPTVISALSSGTVTDILYILWAGLQHLGDAAPPLDEIQEVDLLPLLAPEDKDEFPPLLAAFLQTLPKAMAPNPHHPQPKRNGVGSWLIFLRRWFSRGRSTGSGMK